MSLSDAVDTAVRYELVEAGVALITIDRPQRRNAIDHPTAVALAAALDRLDGEDDISVAILTGSGGGFSAGMDLKAFKETGQRPLTESRGAFGICRRPPVTPLIAAVEGHALGGGCEIALACDLIVAAHDASFGLPEVRLGLVAAAGGLLRLPHRIPAAIALELALTGNRLPAARAAELGLVNRLAEPGRAVETALALAREIAANGPLALRRTRQLVRDIAPLPLEEAFAAQEPLIQEVRDSADAREGTLAFVEKRAAAMDGSVSESAAPWEVAPRGCTPQAWLDWANALPVSLELGLRCDALDATHGRFTLRDAPLRPNPNGAVNGGLLAAVLDQALGTVAMIGAGEEQHVSTASLTVQYLRPAHAPLEIEVSAPKAGRALVFLEARVTDAAGRLTTTAVGTLARVAAPAANPALRDEVVGPLGQRPVRRGRG